jgi:hypothetical protein
MLSREGRLADLLERWHACRQRGESVSIEGLCADDPDLTAELRRQLVVLHWIEEAPRSSRRRPGRTAPR